MQPYNFPKILGGGSKAVWIFSKKSSDLVAAPFPKHYNQLKQCKQCKQWKQVIRRHDLNPIFLAPSDNKKQKNNLEQKSDAWKGF